MKETLSMMVDLQRIDDAMRELRDAQARLQKVQGDNANALEMFEGMLAKSTARIEETRGFHVEREKHLHETEANLSRSRSRVTSVTNQRELNALSKELDNLRRANTQRQEELKQLDTQLAEAQAEHDKRVAERDALKSKMDEVISQLKTEISEREAQASDLNERREAIRAQLSKPMLARYDRISKGRNGLAIVPVTDDGTCTACNLSAPPQQFIRINKMETLESCSSCKRILYYPAALNDELPASDSEASLPN